MLACSQTFEIENQLDLIGWGAVRLIFIYAIHCIFSVLVKQRGALVTFTVHISGMFAGGTELGPTYRPAGEHRAGTVSRLLMSTRHTLSINPHSLINTTSAF